MGTASPLLQEGPGGQHFGQSHDSTLAAIIGSQGTLVQVACNDDSAGSLQSRVRFDAQASVTYYFMVGAFGSGPGGNLNFNLVAAPPPLELALTRNSTGSVKPALGIAIVSGTVTCSRPVLVDLIGMLEQRAGRAIIRGFFGDVFKCDGVTHWTVTVTGDSGRFAGERATLSVNALTFNEDGDFIFDFESLTVRLTGARP